MVNTKFTWTAQIPSGFGMPNSGPDFGAVFGATTARGISATVVRDRFVVVTGPDMGLAQGYFPGTLAWRPPTC